MSKLSYNVGFGREFRQGILIPQQQINKDWESLVDNNNSGLIDLPCKMRERVGVNRTTSGWTSGNLDGLLAPESTYSYTLAQPGASSSDQGHNSAYSSLVEFNDFTGLSDSLGEFNDHDDLFEFESLFESQKELGISLPDDRGTFDDLTTFFN